VERSITVSAAIFHGQAQLATSSFKVGSVGGSADVGIHLHLDAMPIRHRAPGLGVIDYWPDDHAAPATSLHHQ